MKPESGREDLSPIKRALLEIRELRGQLATLEASTREPIAIVGAAVRVPGGVRDLAGFERMLWEGRDAIGPIPPDRWDAAAWYSPDQEAPGRMYTREGGFIDGVQRFDAEFFGISPREAASMDPQQRLALELSWEAIEHSGRAPAALARTTTGVYLGIANGDYGRALFAHPELIDPYFSMGNAYSVASGRISYVLGLSGPALSIDTACSSSLVAIHLAVQALRRGDCDAALAGGVNLILTPEMNVNFSKAGMMARDGRCKTFDAAADGYVRGEGGAMVVLRRLRDAVKGREPILAVIRGSAINQDGRSNGLTAPNGPAQEAVLRSALADAGVSPTEVGYVEAHGTGTPLGDPIEVNAVGAVLCRGREASRPLAIGSVKTNVGHLEAAAGVVGLLKTVLALRKREIPPHLHFASPNPYIDWASFPLTVPTSPTDWPASYERLVAGVSSFGFSGTNAHVVLEEPPRDVAVDPANVAPGRGSQLLVLSARDEPALRDLAELYCSALADTAVPLADLCFTASAGRAHFPHRLAVRGTSATAMRADLEAWLQGKSPPRLTRATVAASPPRIAFLFPGQGPQYAGMGRALYRTVPAFRAAFDECCAALDPLLPRPLRSVVFGEDDQGELLDETRFAQPAMFAMEVALAATWRAWGLHPKVVMGHSFGEYAAACIAGALSIADGARMVAARGRLAQTLPPDGAMLVVEAEHGDVAAEIARHGGRVAIAAINGAANTVISGEIGVVEAIGAAFATRGARTRRLRVSHAFHSPLVDPILDAFEGAIAGIAVAEPRIALVSSLTGQMAAADLIAGSGYWRRHLREPVRFAAAMQTLAEQGITHFVEVSPHPVLLGMGAECVDGAQWLPSLREGHDDWSIMAESMQRLYCDGADPDWDAFAAGAGARVARAPLYPFRRRRYWLDAAFAAPIVQRSSDERWASLSGALDRAARRGPLDLDLAGYPEKWRLLEQITRACATATLRERGVFARAGERHDLGSALRASGFRATYRHLLRRWLERIAEAGLLRVEGTHFVADQPLPDPGLPALWSEGERAFADNRPLFDYVRHCGSMLEPVLCGRESPLETLFPGGSFDLARGLYERSAMMRYVNELAAAAFEHLGALVPAGRSMRVLEIGAGTGGTTSALLPALPPHRFRYCYTDVSDVFLQQARERFGHWPGIEFGLLDLEKPAAEQGYAPGSFDVIVAANAVHAVKDLRSALHRLRELLAPGGLVVLVESTTHFHYFDMTTGLIEGWQHFADDLRGDHPLLGAAAWRQAFSEAGYESNGSWPADGSAAAILGQHVLVARAPGDDAGGGERVGTGHGASNDDPSAAVGAPQASAADGDATQAWRTRFDVAGRSERLELLRELVRGQVIRTLKLDAGSSPALGDRLMDLGMDSLMAVQLRNGLLRALGLAKPLPATLMFDHPTIEAIAAYLAERTASDTARRGQAAQTATAGKAATATPAASIGASELSRMSDDEVARLLDERLGDA